MRVGAGALLLRAIRIGGILLAAGAGSASAAVPVPGAAQTRPIALVGGTVHTVAGAAIPGGVVLFESGRITAVGADVPVPANADRVDASGKHVYPALFDPFSKLGLVEIDEARATLDYDESGDVTPNVQAQVAVNPESELIPVTRSNGVLLALSAPDGGLIGGSSAVLMLDGWTWQDMTLHAPAAMHVTWPVMNIGYAPGLPDSVRRKRVEARDRALAALDRAFEDARAYRTAKRAAGRGVPWHRNDQRWEAMIPVLERRLPVVIEANELAQIQAAVAFAARQGIRMILYGGYDAPRCAALLMRHDVPVIVSRIHRVPERRGDGYDDPFTLPERLRLAGVPFCIARGGGSWNERNLPYEAATAAAYGLPREEALKAVTLYPARILGVADRVGSLEPGKDATLIVTDGDPLDTTSRVERAYIQGRAVDLNDRQKTLYEKYREKYRRRAGSDRAARSGSLEEPAVRP